MFILIRVLFVQSSSPRQIGSAAPRCPTGGDSSHGEAPSGGGGQDPLPDQRRGRAAASGGNAVREARIQAPPPPPPLPDQRRGRAAASGGKAVHQWWATQVQGAPSSLILSVQ
ncbi:hypothetical protein PVAP13_3NG170004 [Panicum virgatum]|uniref:Uncharacterized protein n=1 Tax=Panicum virgatum TaxID=38727 RepID=A0A8T0UDY8_PANVG|nr:hypothetical protein PVAP13_3NG170004 [Panicum virgatum]